MTLSALTNKAHQGGPPTCCTPDSISSKAPRRLPALRARRAGRRARRHPRRRRPQEPRRARRGHGEPVCAVIESMTGARFVHDTLEAHGWSVQIADAQKVKGLAPLAVKTDRIDARVLAVLSQRDLVPAIWLPDPRVRRERELARFRLHLVKHRSPAQEPDPLGADQLRAPLPGHRSLRVDGPRAAGEPRDPRALARQHRRQPAPDRLARGPDRRVNAELRASGADHPYVPKLLTVPGIGWVLAFTIAAEIGEITRFETPDQADRLHRPLPQGGAVGRV